MIANKAIPVILLVSAWIIAGCVSEAAPTVLPESTSELVQSEMTQDEFVEGFTVLHNSQIESESVEEFIARIVARDISYSHPVLVALTQVKSKEMLTLGVSTNSWDVQQCWLFETDAKRECTDEDKESYFRDEITTKIFFASATSDSEKALYLVECFRYWGEEHPRDYYRLVIELKDGKWVKKSILPLFW